MQDTAENPLPKYFYALSPLSSSPEKKKKRRPATEDQAAFRDVLQIILFWYTVLATCPPVQRGKCKRVFSKCFINKYLFLDTNDNVVMVLPKRAATHLWLLCCNLRIMQQGNATEDGCM